MAGPKFGGYGSFLPTYQRSPTPLPQGRRSSPMVEQPAEVLYSFPLCCCSPVYAKHLCSIYSVIITNAELGSKPFNCSSGICLPE